MGLERLEGSDDRLASPSGASLPRLDGITILLAENHPEGLVAMRAMLEQLGARVLAANDGYDALGLLELEEPDLILCDLTMARMDGFEFVARLRHHPRHARRPAIAVSGIGVHADWTGTWQLGFEAYLTKPIAREALLALVALLTQGRKDGGSHRAA